jgi:hypothetical protein
MLRWHNICRTKICEVRNYDFMSFTLGMPHGYRMICLFVQQQPNFHKLLKKKQTHDQKQLLLQRITATSITPVTDKPEGFGTGDSHRQ